MGRIDRIRASACALFLLAGSRVDAGDAVPVAARTGVSLASAAARAWAEDASLVYVENDEDLAAGGVSPRWGYLFRSVSRASCRVYSVEGRSLDGGSIEVAEDLALRLTAPPLPAAWIDSPAALEAAEAELGEQLREAGTSLATMALVRSALRDDRPDATYWLCVYGASGAPSFFVLVDAVSGKVARTWRG